MTNLTTPDKIRELRQKLYCKAKAQPQLKFHQLYDKVWRQDILQHAWQLARANRCAPGVDGVDFADIEAQGLQEWLHELQQELRNKSYQPQAVRRVMIPKAGGGERPLGIPTIKDRIVQTAAKLVIEPIFEADMEDSAYGYRPKRSAIDAVKQVHEGLIEGYTQVVDADLTKYFDNIPHDQLMQTIAARIVDRAMLSLLKSWLKAPVQESGSKGKGPTYTGGKSSKQGTPQGGVISPLLANRYMNRLLRYWSQAKAKGKHDTKIVSYADDFVILSRTQEQAHKAMDLAKKALTKLKLELNETKTAVRDARKETFDFLGYSFGKHHYKRKGSTYMGASPSAKAVQRCKDKIGAVLRPNTKRLQEITQQLNRMLKGWEGYFKYGSRKKSYEAINAHVKTSVRNFLVRRHKVRSRGTRQFSYEYIYERVGIEQLGGRG